MTDWTRRAHIIIRAAIVDAAKDKAEAIMPDINERAMFSVRLSVSGNEPAQAFGCNTALKQSHVQRWKDEFIDLNPVNCTWYLLNSGSELIATNSGAITASGQLWTWADSLGEVGIVPIEGTV